MKEEIIYQRCDPHSEGLTHLAIQVGEKPFYVWATYKVKEESQLPKLRGKIIILPIEKARELYEFKEIDPKELYKDY